MIERRRFKQSHSLEERLRQEANRLRDEAKSLPRGPEREQLPRKARQAETGSHMSEWLTSPGKLRQKARTGLENAKRLRDKAAEALQMADQVGNESRRETLQHIAKSYSSVAQGLEDIASSDAYSSGMRPPMCSGCGTIMKWSRSQLVKDGPTMRHVFLCVACGSSIETEADIERSR
ncbi:hypothetical protein ACNJYD_25210 [Bradyrhizobium sp. DASA03005]|uniref:hypothetical protein n=1 Tax=Bradyrhizobium TaxID=374 RepID=UPI003D9AEE3D